MLSAENWVTMEPMSLTDQSYTDYQCCNKNMYECKQHSTLTKAFKKKPYGKESTKVWITQKIGKERGNSHQKK
jgi:hypothetical protein